MNGTLRPRRFWTTVRVVEAAPGYSLQLDDRALRTPDKAEFAVPTRALAEAVAAEWEAQEGEIDPAHMPLTRAANVSIDRLGDTHAAVVEMLAGYGETDLICHRAHSPKALVARQATAWDPWVDWAREALQAPLIAAAGVMPVSQPPASLKALSRAIAAHDRFEIAALHDLITLTGSAVLGLAVSFEALAVDAAWEVSRVDEAWQISQWGEDAEAAADATRKKSAVLSAAHLLTLLRRD